MVDLFEQFSSSVEKDNGRSGTVINNLFRNRRERGFPFANRLKEEGSGLLIQFEQRSSTSIDLYFIVSNDENEEIRSILVYIGLITVIIFLLLFIFSLINRCIKMFRDPMVLPSSRFARMNRKISFGLFSVKQQQQRSPSTLSISRQTSVSSVSSSSKPSLRIQHLPPLVHV